MEIFELEDSVDSNKVIEMYRDEVHPGNWIIRIPGECIGGESVLFAIDPKRFSDWAKHIISKMEAI